MKLDLLAIAAHPDDAELSCSGTLVKYIQAGKKVGILDLTQGEMGTRGTASLRLQESEEATKIMGVHVRENLGLPDAFLQNDKDSQLKVIEIIRKYQPNIVLANAAVDRHPDHGKAAALAKDACFYAGLRKIDTKQEAWRPRLLLHYIQNDYIKPDIVVDITETWHIKQKAIRAFESQFYNPASKEPESFISSSDFLSFIEARAIEFGHTIGVKYGEGFISDSPLGLKDLDSLI